MPIALVDINGTTSFYYENRCILNVKVKYKEDPYSSGSGDVHMSTRVRAHREETIVGTTPHPYHSTDYSIAAAGSTKVTERVTERVCVCVYVCVCVCVSPAW
jgi:hypothetical protein